MKDFLLSYLDYLKIEKDLKDNSIAAYKRDAEHFLSYLEAIDISSFGDVNNTHILRYFLQLQKEGKSVSTITRMSASNRAIFEYLLNEGLINKDPTRNVKPPKKRRKEPLVLDEKTIEKLFADSKCDNERACLEDAILRLLYFGAFKVSELCELRYRSIDFTNSKINLMDRTVAIKDLSFLKEYIVNYRAGISYDDYIFINSKKEPYTRQGIWKIVKKQASLNGVKLTPQVLRNSRALHLLEVGMAIEKVQELLGHTEQSSIQMLLLIANKRRD